MALVRTGGRTADGIRLGGGIDPRPRSDRFEVLLLNGLKVLAAGCGRIEIRAEGGSAGTSSLISTSCADENGTVLSTVDWLLAGRVPDPSFSLASIVESAGCVDMLSGTLPSICGRGGVGGRATILLTDFGVVETLGSGAEFMCGRGGVGGRATKVSESKLSSLSSPCD